MNRFRTFSSTAAPIFTALLATFIVAQLTGAEPDSATGEIGLEALTRGFVHEGFAQPVVFNVAPAAIVPAKPPDPIDEQLPEYKPRDKNAGWIPGYWSWDGQRKRYFWTSGCWRVWPPSREYVPGYWQPAEGGWRRVSGFWVRSDSQQIQYDPDPPQRPETRPATSPPTTDHLWVPGNYKWQTDRFVWQKSFWTKAQRGWIWTPAHQVWTPAGSVLVDGFWDHPVEKRGLLFAPISIPSDVLKHSRFSYRPRVVIDSQTLLDHLFCDVKGSQYCFGDYYESNNGARGIYPWFAFHLVHGYDPLYEYYHWLYGRENRDWQKQLVGQYRYRIEHEEARPAETFLAHQPENSNPPGAARDGRLLGRSLYDVAAGNPSLELEERARGPDGGRPPGPIAGTHDRSVAESKVATDRAASAAGQQALVWKRPKSPLTDNAERLLNPSTRRLLDSAGTQSSTSQAATGQSRNKIL